jgi:hypothetical protein
MLRCAVSSFAVQDTVTNMRTTDVVKIPDGIDRRGEATVMNRNDLLTWLIRLLPSQFDEVLLRARIPVHHLSAGGAQTTRATEALRYVEQQSDFDEFARIVAAMVAPARQAGRLDTADPTAPWPVNSPAHTRAPLTVAAVTGAAALGLLLLMLRDSTTLVSIGFTGHVWYVLLLGLSAAVSVFSLLTSYVRYTGKALGRTLELGSPIVTMLLIIGLGFALAPRPAQRFDATVFLHGEAGRQVVVLRNRGHVSLDLGADKRTEAVGDKGEARFMGIPADLRGREVVLSLVDDSYELVMAGRAIHLDQEPVYAAIRPRRLPLTGYVANERGHPLHQARAMMAGVAAITDRDGRFELMLPADLSEGERALTITAPGYEPWQGEAVPGGNALRARLTQSRDSP